MATLSFRDARQCVIETIRPAAGVEEAPLEDACGRVLAESISADRDYPATARSLRDGFAVRSEDTPGRLRVTGEVAAGAVFAGEVKRGEAVEIMTGAPVPRGADAVVMVEHTTRDGEFVAVPAAAAGQFVNPQGSEARAGAQLLPPGSRLGYAEIAVLASVGKTSVRVYKRPRVPVLATGDEIVEISDRPLAHQVRNSNAYSLAAQVRAAGGVPEILPVARDTEASTRPLIERGLTFDLLLISGGVSAGKHDLVERVLADLGAEFYFDRVLIQPGQPLVFGRAKGTFFFGLPGNPASTMVTFELFARAGIELLGGRRDVRLPLALARLAAPFRHKPGLTRFLPARLSDDGSEVTPEPWRGSNDIPAMARANALLVAEAERERWEAGDLIRVLIK
ncbi:MAG: gephyrin-like molybdotransferase Glp [Rhodospirillales bacterium]